MTADGRVTPSFAERPGHAFAIQAEGDRARRLAGREFAQDAAYDVGLSLVDPALAADGLAAGIGPPYHIVPVAEAATGLPGLDPAPQTAPRLVGQVLEEQRIHGALEADVQVRDLAF